MDEGPIMFKRTVDVGRDVPIFDDVIIKAVIVGRNQVMIEGAIGGDVGKRLRVQRAKNRRKMGRPGYPKPRLDD